MGILLIRTTNIMITPKLRKQIWEFTGPVSLRPDWETFKRLTNGAKDAFEASRRVKAWQDKKRATQFIPQSTISEVAHELQSAFLVGSLFSQSKPWEIAEQAVDLFADRGFFNVKKSVLFLAAKLAKAEWIATIEKEKTKQEQA